MPVCQVTRANHIEFLPLCTAGKQSYHWTKLAGKHILRLPLAKDQFNSGLQVKFETDYYFYLFFPLRSRTWMLRVHYKCSQICSPLTGQQNPRTELFQDKWCAKCTFLCGWPVFPLVLGRRKSLLKKENFQHRGSICEYQFLWYWGEKYVEYNLFILASLIQIPTYCAAKSLEMIPLISVDIGQSPGSEECCDHIDITGHF